MSGKSKIFQDFALNFLASREKAARQALEREARIARRSQHSAAVQLEANNTGVQPAVPVLATGTPAQDRRQEGPPTASPVPRGRVDSQADHISPRVIGGVEPEAQDQDQDQEYLLEADLHDMLHSMEPGRSSGGWDEGGALGTRTVVRGEVILKSILMPTAQQYHVGTYGQPKYNGQEGIRASVFVHDLSTALTHNFKRERNHDSQKDPIGLCEELQRALTETFAAHPAGREWAESVLLPATRGLIHEAPIIVHNLELVSIGLAQEYRSKFQAHALDPERLDVRMRMWTHQPKAGVTGVTHVDSWVMAEASKPLFAAASQGQSRGSPGASMQSRATAEAGSRGGGPDQPG